MKVATFVAAALVLASSMSLAQQSVYGQSQSERGGNSNSPSTTPSAISPGTTGGTGSGGTHSPLSGPSTPDHAWQGNDPLKSGSGPTPNNSDTNKQMSR